MIALLRMSNEPADDETDEREDEVQQGRGSGSFPEEDINRRRIPVLEDQNQENDGGDHRKDELRARVEWLLLGCRRSWDF